MSAALARRAAGFSLVEALVALTVISVGMIGIAALDGVGLSADRAALARSSAVALASAMAESIRANRVAGSAYAGTARDNGCDSSAGTANGCDPAQLAAHDLWAWNRAIALALPAGAGVVRFTPGAPPAYTIEVRWDEAGAGPASQTLEVRVPGSR